jgi:hypothetical protein
MAVSRETSIHMNRLQLALATGMLSCVPSMALGQSCPRPGLPMVIEYWSADPWLDPSLADSPLRVPLAEEQPLADARFRHRLPSDWPSRWDENPDASEFTPESQLSNDDDSDPSDPPSPDTAEPRRRSRSADSESELLVRDPFSGKYVPVSLSPKWGRPYVGNDSSDETESSQGSSQQLLAGSALSSAAGFSSPAIGTQSIASGIPSNDSTQLVDRSRFSARGGSSSGASQRRSATSDTSTTETSTNTVAKPDTDAEVSEESFDPDSEKEGDSEGGAAGGSAMGGLAGSFSRSVPSADIGISSAGSSLQSQRAAGKFGSSGNAGGSQSKGSGAGGGASASSRSGGSIESGERSEDGGFYQPTPPEPTIPDMLPEVPNEAPDSPGGHPASPHPGLPDEAPVVPEPGSMTLLSVALCCGTAGWLRRRRRRNEQNPESVD